MKTASSHPAPHIVFVTSMAPTGAGEAFVLAEMAFLQRAGLRVTVVPVRPERTVVHEEAGALLEVTWRRPLVTPAGLAALANALLGQPATVWGIVRDIVAHSGGARQAIKNLVALPKACAVAGLCRTRGASHVHGAWASVPASVAWMVSRLTGVPWSFTAIRWDVDEANLLGVKLREAAFVRATSEGAKRDLLSRAPGATGDNVVVVPHGVVIPSRHVAPPGEHDGRLRVAAVGFLVPKKGHLDLVRACALLAERGVGVDCTIIGSGPMDAALGAAIAAGGVADRVRLTPFLPHARLLEQFRERQIDLLVYPSVVAADGQREGIPVALIEALAAGVPVLSTPTGDIPELLGDIAGSLVQPGDPAALASTIERFVHDRVALANIAVAGHAAVAARFDIQRNVGVVLRGLLEGASAR